MSKRNLELLGVLLLGLAGAVLILLAARPTYYHNDAGTDDAYDYCRSVYVRTTNCFNKHDAATCLDLIEKECGSADGE